jgi:hypothetical protein
VVKETVYREHKFCTSAEYNHIVNIWNGYFKVFDRDNVIINESFVTPYGQESEAQEAAEAGARTWIDTHA